MHRSMAAYFKPVLAQVEGESSDWALEFYGQQPLQGSLGELLGV